MLTASEYIWGVEAKRRVMILIRHQKTTKKHQRLTRTLVVLAIVGVLGVLAPTAFAVDYDSQINALRNQINQNKSYLKWSP